MESLARNRPFVDGNKRTAIASAGVFLGLNGKNLTAGQKELERFTLSVATARLHRIMPLPGSKGMHCERHRSQELVTGSHMHEARTA